MADVVSLRIDVPSVARIVVDGHLDDAAARDVLHLAADLVRSGCGSLVLDVDGVTSFDEPAAVAVVGCCRLSRWLDGEVEVVAEGPVARALVRIALGVNEGIMEPCPVY